MINGGVESHLRITPRYFELLVRRHIELCGGVLARFQVQSPEVLQAPDGDYNMDVTARFTALGADFLVLIECKRHKNPVKRELVQVLHDKVRATGAQKGMLFATTNFQAGALEFARTHRIALIQVVSGEFLYHTRSATPPEKLPACLPSSACLLIKLNDENRTLLSVLDASPDTLLKEIQTL